LNKKTDKAKILWLSPNLNHYKCKNLNFFHKHYNVDIKVLAGTGRTKMGDIDFNGDLSMSVVEINVSKLNFGFSLRVAREILSHSKNCNWIQLAREKKNSPLLIFLYCLKLLKKLKGENLKIFSYSHPAFGGNINELGVINKLFLKLLNNIYDATVFYTEESMSITKELGLIKSEKAFYANNTLFTDDIKKIYTFVYPQNVDRNILYIGRLIKNKKVDVLFKYYKKLKSMLNEKDINLSLTIIGDGPMKRYVNNITQSDVAISYLGGIIDEKQISRQMIKTNLVFIPGDSGLSINHAFSYGRPFATIANACHGPEIKYLKHNFNGFLLSGSLKDDISILSEFLVSNDKYYYDNANSSGENLTIQKWCGEMYNALLKSK
jgi:glycosyltransferase involved in cell wall biosynthesis